MDIRSKKGKEHKLTINRRVRTIGHLLNQHKFNMNMINYNTTQETVTTRIRNYATYQTLRDNPARLTLLAIVCWLDLVNADNQDMQYATMLTVKRWMDLVNDIKLQGPPRVAQSAGATLQCVQHYARLQALVTSGNLHNNTQ